MSVVMNFSEKFHAGFATKQVVEGSKDTWNWPIMTADPQVTWNLAVPNTVGSKQAGWRSDGR
jgi:hypothetical protein